MIDPIKLSEITEEIVSKGEKRKYYRFRGAKFYGGIATADCVGCNLRCRFCWSWNTINKPEKIGKFYSSEEVSSKLINIANKAGFNKIRLSGNEPTIAKQHLLNLLEKIPNNILFILETNGILIGYKEEYAKELSRFNNLHVRVSLKGSNKEEFARFTDAREEFFDLQLKALENLEKQKISFHASVISLAKDLDNLEKNLKRINPSLANNLEIENIEDYGGAFSRLRKLINKNNQ